MPEGGGGTALGPISVTLFMNGPQECHLPWKALSWGGMQLDGWPVCFEHEKLCHTGHILVSHSCGRWKCALLVWKNTRIVFSEK